MKAEAFLRDHFKHDQLEEDTFTANTPIGPVTMRNFIVRFPGKKDGVIVLGTHYETNYPLRNINFVGANDGAATTGLLMAIADQLRGKKLDGYSVWLVFFDGEEAFQTLVRLRLDLRQPPSGREMGPRRNAGPHQGLHAGRHDRRQGPRHPARDPFDGLAGRPGAAGGEEIRRRALLLPDRRSRWMTTTCRSSQRGVPSIDVIDLDYGPNNSYHHTAQDTMDKISAHSLTIDGDVFMETIRLIDQR